MVIGASLPRVVNLPRGVGSWHRWRLHSKPEVKQMGGCKAGSLHVEQRGPYCKPSYGPS